MIELLCIPLALLAGVLWGVALEKRWAAKRRGADAYAEWEKRHKAEAALRRATELQVGVRRRAF